MKFLLLVFFVANFAAHAQSDEVDSVITNNYLRALSGSKSAWSFNSTWNYNGGTLANAFGEDRPNIAGASATTAKTDLDAVVNVKYSLTSRQALLLGFGVRWIAPFHSGPISNYSQPRVDAVNPQFMYQYVYGIGPVQSVLQVVAMQWTQQDFVEAGYAQNFSADQEMMYEIGHSGVTLAFSAILVYSTFNKNDPEDQENQSEIQIQGAPYAEYKFNDTFNLRFASNLWIYEHYRNAEHYWKHDTVIDSLGVGITVSRNIYVYPSVQFTPSALSWQNTNFSASANTSLF